MPIYWYSCASGHTSEELRGYEETSIPCPCGRTAHREAVYPVYAITETGGSSLPSRLRDRVMTRNGKWRLGEFQEAQEEVHYAYDKVERQEGVKVKRPNLYKTARRQAKRMGAKVK